jgi:hypothetical protein
MLNPNDPSGSAAKTVGSRYDKDTHVLYAEMKGTVSVEDVAEWRKGLDREMNRIPDKARFKLLVDMDGYEPDSVQVHTAMRDIVPQLLASCGLRPAHIDLLAGSEEMEINRSSRIQCVAFANVHHDETKMASYEERIGKPNQRFFSDRKAAEDWLLGYPLDGAAASDEPAKAAT